MQAKCVLYNTISKNKENDGNWLKNKHNKKDSKLRKLEETQRQQDMGSFPNVYSTVLCVVGSILYNVILFFLASDKV